MARKKPLCTESYLTQLRDIYSAAAKDFRCPKCSHIWENIEEAIAHLRMHVAVNLDKDPKASATVLRDMSQELAPSPEPSRPGRTFAVGDSREAAMERMRQALSRDGLQGSSRTEASTKSH